MHFHLQTYQLHAILLTTNGSNSAVLQVGFVCPLTVQFSFFLVCHKTPLLKIETRTLFPCLLDKSVYLYIKLQFAK